MFANTPSFTNVPSVARVRTARVIAVCADLLQLGLFPLLAEGFVSPLDDVLDFLVCIILTALVGWHFTFLPSFAVKMLPIVDVAPTWTIAVFLATRQKRVPAPMPAARVYANHPAPPQLNPPPFSQ